MNTINWVERAHKLDCHIWNWIGGKFCDVGGNETLPKSSARDGQLLYELPIGDPRDVDNGVREARDAFSDGRWSRLPVKSRKSVLFKLADLIEANREELALLDCVDVGKPIVNALNIDIPQAVANLRSAAEAADKVFCSAYADGPAPNFTCQVRKPVGVVAAIVGWNFPIVLATLKLGPALAMGNSLVLKPSEFACLSTMRLAQLASEAGLPDGVLNVVQGSGPVVGDALARHPDVDLLTFTGSTETGRRLMVAAGQSNMKRLMLECGGKSPYIVFADCADDLDFVARDAAESAFPNQGELCAAGTRVLIQENIRDQFLAKLIEHVATLQPQDPLDPATTFGALINEAHLNKVLGYIEAGKRQGAKLIHSGRRVQPVAGGFYLQPNVFADVDPRHTIAREEIFGPVLCAFSFRNEEEAIRIANDSCYGLAAYAATTDLGRAHRLAQQLNAGLVVISATSTPSPGGVHMGVEAHKQSGFGMEGGFGGLAAYSVTSTLQVLT